MPKAVPHRVAATPDAVRAIARDRLGASEQPDGTLLITSPPGRQPAIDVTLTLRANSDGTDVDTSTTGTIDIPFFSWFFQPLARIARRRQQAYMLAMLDAIATGGAEPPPPKHVVGLPEAEFTPEQATLLASAAAAGAVVGFAAALFGQLSGPIGDAFGASDSSISVALALTRIGALFALFVTALADRRGRRAAILIGVAGSAIACAFSAIAPNLAIFTIAQVFQRGLVITTATVAGIAVIEESPEGARAYAASMLALAGGFGFSLSVIVLPFGDLGSQGWRVPFVVGALSIFLVRPIARHLAETTRYTSLEERADVVRGQVREVFSRAYRRRFWLLGAAAFLTSVFNAPSSQLMNRYLTHDRGFSNSGVALFRTITTGLPGLVGLVLGGRLADGRGRRPVAALGILIATVTQMVFFLMGGAVIWVMSAASILTASAGGIALGTMDAELFATEIRSTSNALLSIVGVLGSGAGFGVVALLTNGNHSLGNAIALTGIGALIAAVLVIPALPESGAQSLDDVSPTGYGPGP